MDPAATQLDLAGAAEHRARAGFDRPGRVPAAPWAAFLGVASAVGTIAAIGSLIWRPIPGTRAVSPILIEGYRKGFNTLVTRCRGTPDRPGLVLGLEPDRGAAAQGLLLEVEPGAASEVWETFRRRELDDADYVPAIVAVRRLDGGGAFPAAAVLVDTRGASYARFGTGETARVISAAAGTCGSNLDYARRSLEADRRLHGALPADLDDLEAMLLDPS